MESNGMSPILKGVLAFIGSMALFTGMDYILDVFVHNEPFTPGWGMNLILAVVVALLTVYGPNAAQRKKNRQDLKDQFTGKR